MKITFIRPNVGNRQASDALEPLTFAALAGLTPPDVARKLFDERIEPIAYDEPTDLAAITVETYNAHRSYQIAGRFRARGVPVVMGGYHPTALPHEALAHADAVVVGDAENIWERVMHDAAHGRLRGIYQSSDPPPLDGLSADRTIFRGKRYPPIRLVQYSRGCRHACEFCAIHSFYGTRLRQRPLHEVIAEIEMQDCRHVLLVDDNIFVDAPKAEELFRAMIPLRVRWSCQVSLDIARHEKLLDLLAESGCTVATIGFESLDVRNLRQMGKRWNGGDDDYAQALAKFRERGIMIYGTFVFGYDHDTVDAFDRTVEFVLRAKFCLANFNPLMPLPATKLLDRLRSEGRLIHDCWWLDPAYRYGQATFHPRGMTADELTEGCLRARRAFTRYASMLHRALDFRANARNLHHLGLFAAANLASRREIFRKQGQSLAGDGGAAPTDTWAGEAEAIAPP